MTKLDFELTPPSGAQSAWDFAVIGSGPAGLATAGALHDAGLSVITLDKGSLASAVAKWPVYMRFFSTCANVELPGFPLITVSDKPTREEYLQYLRRYVTDKGLRVATGREVTAIVAPGRAGDDRCDGSDTAFAVRGRDEWGEPFTLRATRVVVATGAYDRPKLLNCPGEDLPKVSHWFSEVHPYAGRRVAVVGGRNSAAETALLLHRAGAKVTLIHRGAAMAPLKFWLQPDLENRVRAGEIEAHFNSTVGAIRPREIDIRDIATGAVATVANDYVLAMTGYRPETELLADAGVTIDPTTHIPAHDPATLETDVPGLFVAGVVTAGDISGNIFIENSRHHGRLILEATLAAR